MKPSIPESAVLPLRQQILVLRIIVLALVAGVVAFGAYAIVQNIGKPRFLAGKLQPLNTILLAYGIGAFIAGFVVPSIVYRLASPPSAVAAELDTQFGPEVVRVLKIQMRIQTATIVGCALFESGAFANLFGYFQDVELLHLVVAGVLLFGILARFPLTGATEQRIENELRRMEEEQPLRPGTRQF